MAGRYIKVSCTSCAAVFRMARKWIKLAGDDLACPACHEPAAEGDYSPGPISAEDLASIREVTREVAIAAAEELNAAGLAAREEFEKRRVHISRRKDGVYTQGG